MELGITGKRVLVVGASRGIGRAIARAFADEGGIVTAVSKDDEGLGALVEEMGGQGVGHAWLAEDLMPDGAAEALARQIVEERGPVEIVVHAVGGSVIPASDGAIDVREPTAPLSDWLMFLRFNAGIAIEMNHVLIPPMVERGWGRVVHVSSISGLMLRGSPPYASAKAYLNAYTTTIGRALAASGVVVSAVLPGAVTFPGSYWDEQAREQPERMADFLRHHQAVGRMGTPEEIAAFAVLLGSELASFAQAALVPVDGGNM
jgi:3-oxoacyl-[acyl-carrier protein] reductase